MKINKQLKYIAGVREKCYNNQHNLIKIKN